MDLLMFYLGAAGIGLIGCLASTARNPGVNRIASILHFVGIGFTVICGWINFSILDMLAGVLTIFLVGMIMSYIILKIRGKK